eukprot:g5756.t1
MNDSCRVCPMQSRRVTLKLRNLVRKRRLISYEGSLNALFGDPAPGLDKFLVVQCRFGNNDSRVRTYRFTEDDVVYICASDTCVPMSAEKRCASHAFSFSSLSQDLVRHIFRYIRRYHTLYCSSLVSKSMYSLVKHHVGLTGFDSEYIRGETEYVSYEKKNAQFFKSIFVQSQRQLRHLRLVRCENVTDSMICQAAKHLAFQNLVSLKLERCEALTDKAIDAFRCTTTNLKVLVLKTLSQITDRSVVRILKKNASTLEVVNLTECSSLTNSVLFVIRDELVRLRKLYLTELYKLTDEGIQSLLSAPFYNNLQELTLWSVTNVTFMSIPIRLKSLSNLSSLNLKNCFNLKDNSFVDLICKFMKNLVNLNISCCHKLSDESIDAISLLLQKLQFLNVRYLRRLTDRSVQSLTRLQLLEVLNVSFCDKISEKAFIKLCGLGLSEIRAHKMGFTFTDDTFLHLTSTWQKQKRCVGMLDLSGNIGLTSSACHILNQKSPSTARYAEDSSGVFFLV